MLKLKPITRERITVRTAEAVYEPVFGCKCKYDRAGKQVWKVLGGVNDIIMFNQRIIDLTDLAK